MTSGLGSGIVFCMQTPLLILDLALSALGTRYAELRIVRPRADAQVEKSLRQHGQLVPVVCVRSESGYELIDGFKRYRVSGRVGLTMLSARIREEASSRVCKADVIRLNQTSGSVSSLEEGLVVHSLHREDKLAQIEIATLFGRDKSWVSRRLSLVERLSEEVRKNMLLGLLPSVAGMELARLQRCNQDAALASVLKHRLATRDTAKLVSYLLSHPKWEQETVLKSPWTVLDREPKQRPADLEASLLSMRRGCRTVTNSIGMGRTGEAGKLGGLIEETISSAREALSALQPFTREEREKPL
jgi:ParB/RepB/Spo0J family partition protein